jgi:hypothetical protein
LSLGLVTRVCNGIYYVVLQFQQSEGAVFSTAASVVWWLACWSLVPKIAGSIPDEKIYSMPSFGGEVKPSVPCRRFSACKRIL